MILVTNKYANLDLKLIDGVSEVWCFYFNNAFIIYLSCKEGKEQMVADSLPKWVHEEMQVRLSHKNIFLEAKNKIKS